MAQQLNPDEKGESHAKLQQRIRLSQLVGPPPPLKSWARPAWSLHRVGYLVPPKARREKFLPAFLDIYTDYVESLDASKNMLTRIGLLARFIAWDLLLVHECYERPFL
jgi:hypothetical protein